MALDGRALRLAREKFEADRAARHAEWERQREGLYQTVPRLREIDAAMQSSTAQILSTALRQGTDPLPALNRIRAENLRLQAERRTVLRSLRLPEDILTEKPVCPLCGDTGYRDGRLCGGKNCLRSYYTREQQKELSRMLDLGNQSFSSFSLDWYSGEKDTGVGLSPRANMERVLDECRKYAAQFGRRPENLLLWGGPGLGKTFLSAAIAREVSAAGFSVVYDSAGNVFERFETEKFGREDGAEADVSRVLHCDLLILDDLGTEMNSSFVRSALYRVVNTRLIERRSTIISTNLNPEELARRYTPQAASRLEGEYKNLPFFGEDIRQKRKQQREGR